MLAYDRVKKGGSESGQLAWKKRVGRGTLANAATPTPCASDTHVWAFFGTGLLVCLDRDGEQVWERDLVKDYGKYDITFGMGSSPRLWNDLLYVACMTKGPSYVVALNKETGSEVWKKARKLPAEHDGPDAYSTPVVLTGKNRSELLISGADHINSYDLLSGKQHWVSDGLKIASEYGRVIASPAVSDDVIVATSANPAGAGKGRAIALRTGGSGSVSKSHRAWSLEKSSPDSSTPVCYEGNAYLITDEGVATCIDLSSGEAHWQKRLGKGPYHTAAVAGDGKVYFVNIEGQCVVVEAGSEGKILSKNQLAGTF